jgi:cyclopropane fatty-acyl-phospholipid synthase-like methyltransferase
MAWRDHPWSEVFDADYLRSYEEPLEERRPRGRLHRPPACLEAGAELLDAPCGHGGIANRLAARGVRVVGLDNDPAFLERARTDAAAMGGESSTCSGICATCGYRGPSTPP